MSVEPTAPLRIVDPHVHLWDLSTGLYPGLETPSTGFIGNNAPIARTYGLDELLGEADDTLKVVALVHVEAFPTDPVEETRRLQALADGPGGGFPQALVVASDLAAPDAGETLDRQQAFGRVRGVRQILNRHDDPCFDYGVPDNLLNPDWERGFAELAARDLSFDLQIYSGQMEQAAELAARHPDVSIVLNHAGMPATRGLAGWRAWKRGLAALAARENVTVKIGGLGMFDHHWSVESFRPWVLETLDHFGAARAMFASNFPVDKLFGTYSALWHAFSEIVRDLSDAERSALFVDTATRGYRLDEQGA